MNSSLGEDYNKVILSPFLFLLAVRGLNVLMNVTVEVGLFTGYGVGTQGNVTYGRLKVGITLDR